MKPAETLLSPTSPQFGCQRNPAVGFVQKKPNRCVYTGMFSVSVSVMLVRFCVNLFLVINIANSSHSSIVRNV